MLFRIEHEVVAKKTAGRDPVASDRLRLRRRTPEGHGPSDDTRAHRRCLRSRGPYLAPRDRKEEDRSPLHFLIMRNSTAWFPLTVISISFFPSTVCRPSCQMPSVYFPGGR